MVSEEVKKEVSAILACPFSIRVLPKMLCVWISLNEEFEMVRSIPAENQRREDDDDDDCVMFEMSQPLSSTTERRD